jgi:hypothetical protein
MSSSLENILVGESVMKEGGNAAVLGSISFAVLFSMASFIERNVVGILATTAEYVVSGRNPRITDQNVQLLKGVSKENPSQGLYSFLQLYPFAIDEDHIQQQLNQETEKTGFEAVKSWILGDSKLLAAVVKAKEYSEDLKKHQSDSTKTSKPKAMRISEKSTSEKKTGVRKVRRRKKSKGKEQKKCIATTKKGTPCRWKAEPGHDHCGTHKKCAAGKPDHDVFPKKTQLAKQVPLMF